MSMQCVAEGFRVLSRYQRTVKEIKRGEASNNEDNK